MMYQASKKTDFTVDLLWWDLLRLTPIIASSHSLHQIDYLMYNDTFYRTVILTSYL